MNDVNLELVQKFRATTHEKGPAAAMALYATNDVIWWVLGRGEVQDQIDGLMQIMRNNYDGDGMQIKIKGTTSEKDRVAIEAECFVRLKNGSTYNNNFHFLYIIRNGKVAAIREYHDTAHALEIWGPVFEQDLPAQGVR